MNMKGAYRRKGLWFLAATLVVVPTVWFFSSFGAKKESCPVAEGQTVVRWKDMYWFPCKYSWNGICFWPIRRKHFTYKVTMINGVPLRDEMGNPIPTANGEIKTWATYDSALWNKIEDYPNQKIKFPDYEKIAENEYVVIVETRYRLFHNVEKTLRICAGIP